MVLNTLVERYEHFLDFFVAGSLLFEGAFGRKRLYRIFEFFWKGDFRGGVLKMGFFLAFFYMGF